mmetsp:Transcript_19690/g.33881  ORF Transcript_19690/g.33881 Transcript_19690/m.33881 type:complete len:94 (-) Transcript_19690:44-325(-)
MMENKKWNGCFGTGQWWDERVCPRWRAKKRQVQFCRSAHRRVKQRLRQKVFAAAACDAIEVAVEKCRIGAKHGKEEGIGAAHGSFRVRKTNET